MSDFMERHFRPCHHSSAFLKNDSIVTPKISARPRRVAEFGRHAPDSHSHTCCLEVGALAIPS